MKVFYTYILAHPTGTPFYAGKGYGDRWKDHVREAQSSVNAADTSNPRKVRTIRKILASGADVVVELFPHETETEALAAEKVLIKRLRKLHGRSITNLTDGGEGICGFQFSPESLSKMSQTQLTHASEISARIKAYWARVKETGEIASVREKMREGRRVNGTNEKMRGVNNPAYGIGGKGRKMSDKTKALLSELRSGDKNPMFGKRTKGFSGGVHSKESREKMSSVHAGKPRKPETIARTAAANRGKKRTPEQCRNISIAKLAAAALRREAKATSTPCKV